MRATPKSSAHRKCETVLLIAVGLCLVLIALKLASLALRCDYPALSISTAVMEPTLRYGDLALLAMPQSVEDLAPGDIIAFTDRKTNAILMQRIVYVIRNAEGVPRFSTRGDAEPSDSFLTRVEAEDVVGRVYTWLPLLGHVTVFAHQHPFLILVILALLLYMMLRME